ncbi:hypothetical protein EVAR_90347_1 [Eumeta japonica]|uniref:Uncharacterized protein n=1 Tax=Eumeta variegata TaxID=151549 RepID=A0A4C1YGH7_EUMVA|nr:hypothetical protein EVAR_90347_1 [Eumeta japonica]
MRRRDTSVIFVRSCAGANEDCRYAHGSPAGKRLVHNLIFCEAGDVWHDTVVIQNGASARPPEIRDRPRPRPPPAPNSGSSVTHCDDVARSIITRDQSTA